jgi:hypothetical protein
MDCPDAPDTAAKIKVNNGSKRAAFIEHLFFLPGWQWLRYSPEHGNLWNAAQGFCYFVVEPENFLLTGMSACTLLGPTRGLRRVASRSGGGEIPLQNGGFVSKSGASER